MPVKPFFGNALSERKVVANFFYAYLETFFKATQLHVYDSMLLIQIKIDRLNELEDRVWFVQHRS